MKYCEFCGAPIEAATSCSCEEAIAEKAKKQKRIKRILFAGSIIGVLAVALIIIIAIISTANKIDPADYTEVTFSGYNTNGTAKINFNVDELIYDVIGEEPEEEEEWVLWWNLYDEYSETITYKHSPAEKLSNGDEITVEFIIPDSLTGKIKNGIHKYTVENLPELTYVDVFDNLKVNFEGVSGDAEVKIEITNDEEYMEYFSFKIEPRYNLKNGDKVTITIDNAEAVADKHYIASKELKKEFIVENRPAYVTSIEQLPIEKINEIAKQFIESTSNNLEPDSTFTYGEVKYYKSFLLTEKEEGNFTDVNRLEIFVLYDEYKRGELFRTVYTSIKFENILVYPDGTIELDYNDGSASGFTTDIENYIEKLEDKYQIEKID